MDFDFSEEQIALGDQARRMLAQQGALAAARAVMDGGLRMDGALWARIADLGWPGVTIPERHGGLGLGHLALCVIAEELGRSLAPTPFSSSIYLAAEGLMIAGSEELQALWLPQLASAEIVGTIAIAEGRDAAEPDRLGTRFENGSLYGAKTAVPDGMDATIALVLAQDMAHSGATLVLADLTGPGVTRDEVRTVDPSRGHAEIRFDGCPATPLGEPGQGWAIWNRLRDRAAILFGFEAIGGARACLDMAIDWAKERHSFARPIGSYQAIKHNLADMFVGIELARSNAYYGAWALSTDAPQLTSAAAATRTAAADAYWRAARENLHIHGGMGVTHESDCHLHYRRAKLLSLNLGSLRFWRDRLVDEIAADRAGLGH